ncbi:MAG: chemotaxis protein CheW [Oscillospiraceae bacterium]|nr:chemotaxis protein CheW [Oscillospiraceae bacterium]
MQDIVDIEDLDLEFEDVMLGKYLTFLVGDGGYGIEISYVVEIISVQEITLVPHTHPYVKGIINLRGTVIPVIDMAMRFGQGEVEYSDKTCIIVLSMDDMSVGILVDGVQDVTSIDDENVQDPPKITGNYMKNYFIKAVGVADGEVKQLIDVYKVFEVNNDDELILSM